MTAFVQTKPPLDPDEIAELLKLKQTFLRAALLVSGSLKASPAASKVAGAEVGALKTEIAALETQLGEAKAA